MLKRSNCKTRGTENPLPPIPGYGNFLGKAPMIRVMTLKRKHYKTRRLAACTQAVVILRSTSYIAIELNVLHLKAYEIQSNRYAQAIQPLIALLGID